MALVRANEPGLALPTLGGSFSTMLDRFFDEAVRTNQNFVPTVDLKETSDRYEIDVNVPGLNRDDISVELDGNTLHISGQKERRDDDKDKTFHRVETEYGYFHRSFNLPESAKTEDINAEYENGVLKVHVPKDAEKTQTKKIEIK
jgi:Molecular chaperone (small heat shock protein)